MRYLHYLLKFHAIILVNFSLASKRGLGVRHLQSIRKYALTNGMPLTEFRSLWLSFKAKAKENGEKINWKKFNQLIKARISNREPMTKKPGKVFFVFQYS